MTPEAVPDRTGLPGTGGTVRTEPAPCVAVTRLQVTDFRCYRRAEVVPGARSVVVTGANGAGKTNLLEALSFLAPGRGLRRAQIADVERLRPGGEAGGTGWAVAAVLSTDEGERRIGTGRQPVDGAAPDDGKNDGNSGSGMDQGSDRRVVRIDGETAKSQTVLSELVHFSWLTPEMDRLFLESATGRRRFLDRIVYGFVPHHATQLSAYERAMRERSRLLRDGRLDERWLDALEATMAEAGIAVAAARREVVNRLSDATELASGAFPVPALDIHGETERAIAAGPALAAEDAFRDRLRRGRRLDAEAGRALDGPHRSDLDVVFKAKNMPAALCSTGEQKALLIAIVLAAARLQTALRGAPPILLLDEIAAHLDPGRRAALFDEVAALGLQAWMTGTDASLFEQMAGRAAFMSVEDAQISRTAPPRVQPAARDAAKRW